MYVVYPAFFFMLLCWLSYYKYEEIGGFNEDSANYFQAEQKHYKKWREKQKIRLDKQKKEKFLDEINKRIKNEKKIN